MTPELYASGKRHEGVKPVPYKDSKGLWTFGIGHCLESRPLTGAQWKRLLDAGLISVTLAEAGMEMLYGEDMTVAAADCQRFFSSIWARLTPARKDVLTEMVFQMGVNRVSNFHDFFHAVIEEDWSGAKVAGLDSKWARIDSPDRAKELMDIFERGTYA